MIFATAIHVPTGKKVFFEIENAAMYDEMYPVEVFVDSVTGSIEVFDTVLNDLDLIKEDV
jgi:hypothetical protein